MLIPLNISDWKEIYDTINWKDFGMLDKVHYYNKSTKMIYIEVVKSSKRKKEANGSPEQI